MCLLQYETINNTLMFFLINLFLKIGRYVCFKPCSRFFSHFGIISKYYNHVPGGNIQHFRYRNYPTPPLRYPKNCNNYPEICNHYPTLTFLNPLIYRLFLSSQSLQHSPHPLPRRETLFCLPYT